MSKEEIRAKIRDRLKSGLLPRNVPIPHTPSQNFDAFSVHSGGSKCSACDGDKPHFTIKYPDGKTFSLHHECDQIWKEECEKFIPN